MNEDRHRPVEPSRQEGRVWLLIVICSTIGLLAVSMALWKGLDASARFIASAVHHP
jgi:hypothetical protein